MCYLALLICEEVEWWKFELYCTGWFADQMRMDRSEILQRGVEKCDFSFGTDEEARRVVEKGDGDFFTANRG